MSGVVWCCCGPTPTPVQCPCDCVCANAWHFQNELQIYPEAYEGSLLGPTPPMFGVNKDEEWTLLMWLDGCFPGHDEEGSIWNTYTEEVEPNITEWLWLRTEDNHPSCPAGESAIVLRLRLNDELQTKENWEIVLCTGQAGIPGNCKMLTVQYRQVSDQGRLVPEVKMRLRWMSYVGGVPVAMQQVTYQQIRQPILQTGNNVGLEIPTAAKTWVGAHVPRCDPFHNVAFEPLNGCMDNLTIYTEWLDETQYEEKWNNFEGLLDDTAWERWCPTPNFCSADQVGELRNIVLQSHCPIKDGNGDLVEDEGNRCIFSRPAV